MNTPKNLFATKTFQAATFFWLGTLSPIAIACTYEHRKPSKEETITAVGAFITYSWALIGRSQNTPVYTPDYLPGANKSDFEQ